MKKISTLFLSFMFLHLACYSQLATYKMVGKNSSNAKLGFGLFAYTQIPLNDIGNRNIMIELMDLAYFPQKDEDVNSVIAYISVKVGYKYIFSSETNTGFYIEPSVGYCRVVNSEGSEGTYGDGVALAAETGYILGVGQQDNTMTFGIKYETDRAGTNHTLSAVGLRISYSFHLFRKRDR